MSDFTTITGRNELWPSPDPDRNALLAVIGGAAATNARNSATAAVATAVNSPSFYAFALAGDADHIYIGQNPTFFPNDLTRASAYDDTVAMLVGNNLEGCSRRA